MAEPTELQGVLSGLKRKDLEYPLNNSDDYKGRVVFNVMKEDESDLGNALGTIVDMGRALAQKASLENVAGENPEDQQKSDRESKGSVPRHTNLN